MKKNISRSNFENVVGQFLHDMLVKICANFYSNPENYNVRGTFLVLYAFLIECLDILGNDP